MKKLMIFTLYSSKGASSNYRVYIYKEKLEKNFDVRWFKFWDDNYTEKYLFNKKKYLINIIFTYMFSVLKRLFQLLFIAPKADIILIQKEVIPKIKVTFLKKLRDKGIKIIYDIDDAIYEYRNDNSHIIAKYSDIVFCGNDILKNYYGSYCDNCIIIPTIENTNKYKKYWSDTFDKKIIGWIGSKTTINNLDLVMNPINKLVEKHPEVSFHIISNTVLDYNEKINNVNFIKWDKNTYIEELSKITIGIMPLKNNEFNKGKCGFKLIQYLNMKKPVLASDVGVNSEIVGNNGFLAYDEEDWQEKIEKLLFNQEVYEDKLMQIENEFFKKYDFESISNRIIYLILELIENKE